MVVSLIVWSQLMHEGPKCDDLEFPVSRSPQIKGNGGFGLPLYDFLLVPHTNYVPICDGLAAIEHRKVATLSFRFQGHHRSNVKIAFDPSHMGSY